MQSIIYFLIFRLQTIFMFQINELKQIGGNNIYDFIRRALSMILTNEIANKYSFFGRKKKKTFCNLNICKLLISEYYICLFYYFIYDFNNIIVDRCISKRRFLWYIKRSRAMYPRMATKSCRKGKNKIIIILCCPEPAVLYNVIFYVMLCLYPWKPVCFIYIVHWKSSRALSVSLICDLLCQEH